MAAHGRRPMYYCDLFAAWQRRGRHAHCPNLLVTWQRRGRTTNELSVFRATQWGRAYTLFPYARCIATQGA
eukprot:1744015-Pyramimonas_sp.AAC.1